MENHEDGLIPQSSRELEKERFEAHLKMVIRYNPEGSYERGLAIIELIDLYPEFLDKIVTHQHVAGRNRPRKPESAQVHAPWLTQL